MGNLETFIEHLNTQVKNHSIYVWAAQGEGAETISEKWIKKQETSSSNATRAINFWKKQVNAGYGSVLKAFDCSGLGMYMLAKLFKYSDMTADNMRTKLTKKINRSDLKRGDWVFKVNDEGKATHIGYVVDKALNVVEAKGRDYGVVCGPVDDGAWNAYGRPTCFEKEILDAYVTPVTFKVGDLVSIASNATWWDGSHIPDWVKKQNWYIFSVGDNGRIVINQNEAKTEEIRSPISKDYLKIAAPSKQEPADQYKVKVTAAGLNYRAGPGTNYKINGVITDKGIYTIVKEEKDSKGQTWGKLLSGVGWINLYYTKKI